MWVFMQTFADCDCERLKYKLLNETISYIQSITNENNTRS